MKYLLFLIAMSFAAMQALAQTVTLDLTGDLDRIQAEDPSTDVVVDESAPTEMPLPPSSEEVGDFAESMNRQINLDLDIDVGALIDDADLQQRFDVMNFTSYQPDGDVPPFGAREAMIYTLALRPETVNAENVVILGSHLETNTCREASLFMSTLSPGDRRSIVERTAQAIVAPAHVSSFHRLQLPVYDDRAGRYVFPDLEFGTITYALDMRLVSDFSGSELRSPGANDQCRWSGDGFVSGLFELAGPLPVASLEVDLAGADRIFRSSRRSFQNRDNRYLLAHVVSRPLAVSSEQDGDSTVILGPERIHLYGSTTDEQPYTPRIYVISYNVMSGTWYYDLPVLDASGRLLDRETVVVSVPNTDG